MDYWEQTRVHRHVALEDFLEAVGENRVWMFSTRGARSVYDARFSPGDALLFGPETRGLPQTLLAEWPERVLRIPMRPEARSLNLATSVAVALYEGVRQLGLAG